MKTLLIIKRIKVENANAISGLTYGFPAMSHFLGFTHALSRRITARHPDKYESVILDGCAVVCHSHQNKVHQPAGWGDYVFSQSRNPLTREGKTPSFNEEGKIHMEVSLLIECDADLSDAEFNELGADLKKIVPSLRLAGGVITQTGEVKLQAIPSTTKAQRKLMFSLLPGFLILDRSSQLLTHYESLKKTNPDSEMIDAWLDFCALKYRALPLLKDDEAPDENTRVEWERIDKPASGWLVPIMTGYKAISPLYPPGQVENTRDRETPFRFAESIYGVGEWISPHRISNIEDIFWRYHVEGDWYLCLNDANIDVTLNQQGVK